MKIAFDVAQTCHRNAGCAWHAQALAGAMRSEAGSAGHGFLLYHHFGLWINPKPSMGVRMPGVPEPFFGMPAEEAASLWRDIENGSQEAPGAPDIVHSNSYMAPQVRPAKLVYTVHDLCFWTHPQYGSERNRLLCQDQLIKALQRADGFHFISQTSRDDFERMLPGWLDWSGRPWLVARSGLRLNVDHARSPEDRFDDPSAPWIFVGTIDPRKNVDALLDAYLVYWEKSVLKRPLRLSGAAGWQSDATLTRLSQLGERLPIEYLGYTSEESLADLYAQAFAAACPSHYEGFGLTSLEALACALPLLANPHPAAAEFPADALRFVDFAHPQAVADAMLALESKRVDYLAQAKAAVAAAAPYSWRSCARSLLDFYQNVLLNPAANRATVA